jgi:hypothetical protein
MSKKDNVYKDLRHVFPLGTLARQQKCTWPRQKRIPMVGTWESLIL